MSIQMDSDPKFNAQELGILLLSNGFPKDEEKLATMIAISRAENRTGDPAVVNSAKAVGLFQIHQPSHPSYTVEQLKDPDTNAQAAVKISNGGTNFMPWDTYRLPPKPYLLFLPEARIGAKRAIIYADSIGLPNAPGQYMLGNPLEPPGPLKAVSDVLEVIGTAKFWRRVVSILMGLALIVAGLMLLQKDLATGAISKALSMKK